MNITLEDALRVLHEYNRENPAHLCVPFRNLHLQFSSSNVQGLQKLLNRIGRFIDGAGVRESDLSREWRGGTWDILSVWEGYGHSANSILHYYDIEESLRAQYSVSDAVIFAAFWAYDIPFRGKHELRSDFKARERRREYRLHMESA